MWTDVVSERVQRGVLFSYLDVSSIYQKNQDCYKRKKDFSGYFLLNVVNCKSKKCSEMKIVRRDDNVPDSV